MRIIASQAVAAKGRSTRKRSGDPRPEAPEPSTNGSVPPGRRGQVRVEQGTKRVRAYLGGAVVVDSIAPLLVWEVPYYPTYYFPETDVRADLVADGGSDLHSPSRGDAKTLSVLAGGSRALGAAALYENSPIDELRGTVRLQWDAMEAWFEEDEEVYTHPRDPYTRVDILASSRRVRVLLDDLVLADSTSPRLLFETGLPTRYYLPRTHVRMDLLEASPTVTHCPYKGRAETWSVRVGETLHEDLAWSYPAPLPESQKIAGLIAFYDEKLDIEVAGVRQERPRAKFGNSPRAA
ncbi:MAG TPA: DUF427 domain-containing protein [Solirubrobacteraceae bacterium]